MPKEKSAVVDEVEEARKLKKEKKLKRLQAEAEAEDAEANGIDVEEETPRLKKDKKKKRLQTEEMAAEEENDLQPLDAAEESRRLRKEKKQKRLQQEETEAGVVQSNGELEVQPKKKKKNKLAEDADDADKEKGVLTTIKSDQLVAPEGGIKKKRRERAPSEAVIDDTLQSGGATSSSVPATSSTNGPEAIYGTRTPGTTTVLLFYQYVEPMWTPAEHKKVMQWAKEAALRLDLKGRIKAAREGFNCTLTSTADGIRQWCRELRAYSPYFAKTEFKITDGLPSSVMWDDLEVVQADEIVGYGLDYEKAPSLVHGGTHLEPEAYHKKMEEPNTVIIDVRNTYEADIGRFDPRYKGPSRQACGAKAVPTGAEYIDPKMRRSTDWAQWLQKPETQEKLKGKQVMMFCTGGIRCERASALLNAQLGDQVEGLYQCQGGIDKYLKTFPDGGHFIGKNYVFDKRWEQGPGVWENEQRKLHETMGRCLSCSTPWDDYRQQKRCKTCGVPILVCTSCIDADVEHKLDKLRCRVCVEDNIKNKGEYREIEQKRNEAAAEKVKEIIAEPKARGTDAAAKWMKSMRKAHKKAAIEKTADDVVDESVEGNPDKVTRLFVGNLHAEQVEETNMVKTFPGVTHIQYLKDKDSGKFFGSCFLEMDSAASAAKAVKLNGTKLFGRAMRVKFEPMKRPGRWPPLGTAVGSGRGPGNDGDLGPPPFPKCRKFFLRGVSKKATDEDVRKFFRPLEVQAMRWMTHRETGEFRGCGHVDFWTPADAQAAAEKHGAVLHGEAVMFEWAT